MRIKESKADRPSIIMEVSFEVESLYEGGGSLHFE
jgi:hypothetical protein